METFLDKRINELKTYKSRLGHHPTKTEIKYIISELDKLNRYDFKPFIEKLFKAVYRAGVIDCIENEITHDSQYDEEKVYNESIEIILRDL